MIPFKRDPVGLHMQSLTDARGGVVSLFAPSEPAVLFATTHLFQYQSIAM
jgi:hypothetical protein